MSPGERQPHQAGSLPCLLPAWRSLPRHRHQQRRLQRLWPLFIGHACRRHYKQRNHTRATLLSTDDVTQALAQVAPTTTLEQQFRRKENRILR